MKKLLILMILIISSNSYAIEKEASKKQNEKIKPNKLDSKSINTLNSMSTKDFCKKWPTRCGGLLPDAANIPSR